MKLLTRTVFPKLWNHFLSELEHLRHCISSLISPQSFQPSHFSCLPMQIPDAHANWLGQAAQNRDMMKEEEKRKRERDDDKVSKWEWQCVFKAFFMLPMLVPVDQSNYKSISAKLGLTIKSGGYWKQSAPDWQWQIKWTQINKLSGD